MTSPQARKGATYERDVTGYFRTHGQPYAERAYGAGRPDDVGDINGIVGWALELKNHKQLALASWLDEAEKERVNARARFAAVIHKRRGKSVGESLVTMTLKTFCAFLDEEVEA